jgi:hypothetical protein
LLVYTQMYFMVLSQFSVAVLGFMNWRRAFKLHPPVEDEGTFGARFRRLLVKSPLPADSPVAGRAEAV